jgi:hypothetical protein
MAMKDVSIIHDIELKDVVYQDILVQGIAEFNIGDEANACIYGMKAYSPDGKELSVFIPAPIRARLVSLLIEEAEKDHRRI